MREDQPLVRPRSLLEPNVLLHSEQLAAPRRAVLPWRRREQVVVEQGGEFSVRLDRARHRLHKGEVE